MAKRPLVNDAYLSLQPYVPGKPVAETERELGIRGVVKLASNENPLGPSAKAVEAIQKGLSGLHDYPDGSAFYLKRRLAEHLGWGPEHLIVGNGTNELIEMLIRTCMRPGENMLYVPGTFVIYKLCAQAAGVPVKETPLRNMHYDLDAVADLADAQTKLVFIANPNNPTGTYVGASALQRFVDALDDDVLVVIDEAYREYVRAPDYPNGLDFLRQRERCLLMRTFSKCYGLAGARVGYAVGHPELIDYLNRGRQPFNVNNVGQWAASAALDDTEHLEASVALNHAQMDLLVPALRERGLGVTDSQANFVLVDFYRDATAVFEALLRQGVIVRPMGGYGFPTAARVTVGTEAQNAKLLSALDAVLPRIEPAAAG